MNFQLGVLLIHGMGSQEAGYANRMIEELKDRVRRLGSDDRRICFEPAWWAPVLARKQEDLIRALADGNDLDWMPLRRFILHSLADAVAYQVTYRPTSKDQINVYRAVHNVLRDSMRNLRRRIEVGDGPRAETVPLVVIAHSLGCHMITNYIYDVRHAAPSRRLKNGFDRFETLAGMITFGCSIPIFTLALTTLDPIEFPAHNIARIFPDATQDELDSVTKWLNFYDPDDVLGYPLRTVDPKYAAVVSEDIAVNVGGLLRSWNPLSHSEYWTDNDVTRPTAELLHKILRLRPRARN
ncbi:hypothetical protein BH24PSE2_BH24PSE2_20470 [soil metagenome]